MISVREKIDRIKIPAQVESLSVDDPNDDRHQSISTATTAVKREAIRVIIAAAIEDQASLDPEGSETFVRGRSGDEETGPSSKMRRIESENLPPSSGIRFIASDSTIDHLDEIYLDCVSSTTAMPSEFDTIWSFDDLRSRYKPDVSENDIYTHIDNSLILALEYLVDPKLGLLRKQVKRRRFERAKNTKSPDTNDGMTDFVGVGTSKDGSALRHPPLWEIKRKNVWSTVLFRWLRRASELDGGVVLNMVDDIPSFRWPGKQDEEWHLPMNKVKRAKMEDVLKQIILQLDQHTSANLILSTWDAYQLLHRASPCLIEISKTVIRDITNPQIDENDTWADMKWNPFRLMLAVLLATGEGYEWFEGWTRTGVVYRPVKQSKGNKGGAGGGGGGGNDGGSGDASGGGTGGGERGSGHGPGVGSGSGFGSGSGSGSGGEGGGGGDGGSGSGNGTRLSVQQIDREMGEEGDGGQQDDEESKEVDLSSSSRSTPTASDLSLITPPTSLSLHIASDLGLSFKCDANTLKDETLHRPDTRHWAKLEFKHAGILSGSAIDETRMTSPVPGLPAASTIVSLSGDKNSVEDDWSFEDRPKSRESGQARYRRRRRSAPPYSLSIKSYISHGRLSDAYHSTLRSYSSLTQTYSSLTDSRRTPKVYPSVTKLIDLNTFPKTTADEYTYSAVEARKAALNEVVMMHRLRSVWGTVVPRLYGSWISVSSTRDLESGPGRGGAGEDGDGKEEQVVVLCMQDAGEMWTDRPETLHPTDKQRILSLYESIHALGIVHNDVEPRHIRYDASTGVGPFLIDFDGASFVGVGENDVHGLREREMVRVMAMLDGYQFESR